MSLSIFLAVLHAAWNAGIMTGGSKQSAMMILAVSQGIWAMTQAPIALVAALRETSILFAMLIVWLWFGDKMGAQKALAGALIIGGVVLTRL